MTTTLRLVPGRQGQPADRGPGTSRPGDRRAAPPSTPPPPLPELDDAARTNEPLRGWLARHPAWPITALVVGYPLWWALGTADFMWIVLAFPMAARMVAWHVHGSRRLKVPPGFGIWLLFLVCAAAGIAVLTLTAPGTVPSAVSHRVISYFDRTASYVGVTILMLYAGNLTERELPRRRIAWMLGLVAIYTVIGGLAAMILPNFQFSSPFLLLLPHSVQSNTFIQASMHPALAQIQNVLGTPGGRPKAPFDYTNNWGNCLTILIPFLIAGWWTGGKRRQRLIAGTVIALSVVPLLYSLNRAAWIGTGVSVGYLAVRLAARGKMAMIGGLCVLIALAGILILATPLQGLITGRLSTGGSYDLRSNLAALTIKDVVSSPVMGYGDTRQERGSPSSIAIGPSPDCPSCGQLAVGSTGQLWLLLVCSGFPGAFFYLGFFAYGIWRFRRDRTPYGLAGQLVLLLGFVYIFTYDAVGAAIGFTMLIYALMWKSDQVLHGQDADQHGGGPRRPRDMPAVPAVPAAPALPGPTALPGSGPG